jgi:hypothetical protein
LTWAKNDCRGEVVSNSKSYRVLTALRFSDGRQISSEAVIALGDGKQPYQVLSWQDDVETGHRSRRQAGG